MQIYLVGGAVRDKQLGLPVREKDWVVVGGTAEALKAQGYRLVGKSFPVFLHPETGEEYALARTETKTGPGYRGFTTHSDTNITLEQDLKRRDLTINAMAEDSDGTIIDPYGGLQDLNLKVLRHVSDAFHEDPLRILRVARFAARYHELGFAVAKDTLELMAQMTAGGEADALVPERVWQETELTLMESRPDVFFKILKQCGALAVIYPELDALFGVPQPEKWHPEVDTGVHTMLALKTAAQMSPSSEVRFAALVHDLGKGTTPREQWPGHRAHEQRSVALVQGLCQRLGVPNRYRDLAAHVALYHPLCHRALELRPTTVLRMLEHVDAFRRPDRCEDFLLACKADARGRTGRETAPYPQADLIRQAREAAAEVGSKLFKAQDLTGKALGAAIHKKRIEAITQVKAEFQAAN